MDGRFYVDYTCCVIDRMLPKIVARCCDNKTASHIRDLLNAEEKEGRENLIKLKLLTYDLPNV